MLIPFKGLVTTFYVSFLCHKSSQCCVMDKALTKFRNNLIQVVLPMVSYISLTKHSISIFSMKEKCIRNTNSSVI